MRVLYDHQIFIQNYGGISRYFCELIEQFRKEDSTINSILSLKISDNYYLKNIYGNKYTNFFSKSNFKGGKKVECFLNNKQSSKMLKKMNYEAFHPTYYDPYFLKYIGDKPFVLTVYDMIHEVYPDLFKSSDKTIENKKLLIEKADKIIAISESTKRDIIKLYDIPQEKIEVIYLASSLKLNSNCSDIIVNNLPERFILFVGQRAGYKNFDLFIEAISEIFKEDKGLKLVSVGGGEFSIKELDMLSILNIKDKVIHITADDNTLSMLYKKALVFVFPSLYEGFGIPVLEAFNCECPVALSNSSSFPEVAGEAGIYFDPTNKASIKDSIVKIIYDKKLQNELREKGKLQSQKFSWEKIAEKTKQLYSGLL